METDNRPILLDEFILEGKLARIVERKIEALKNLPTIEMVVLARFGASVDQRIWTVVKGEKFTEGKDRISEEELNGFIRAAYGESSKEDTLLFMKVCGGCITKMQLEQNTYKYNVLWPTDPQ